MKKKKIKRFNKRLKFGNQLNENLPRSEAWFQNLYKGKYSSGFDLFNYPVDNFIPDVVNFNLKYIIEIDGSIHNIKKVYKKDLKKQKYYENKGFTVFRVKAYCMDSFNKTMESLLKFKGCGVVNKIL